MDSYLPPRRSHRESDLWYEFKSRRGFAPCSVSVVGAREPPPAAPPHNTHVVPTVPAFEHHKPEAPPRQRGSVVCGGGLDGAYGGTRGSPASPHARWERGSPLSHGGEATTKQHGDEGVVKAGGTACYDYPNKSKHCVLHTHLVPWEHVAVAASRVEVSPHGSIGHAAVPRRAFPSCRPSAVQCPPVSLCLSAASRT